MLVLFDIDGTLLRSEGAGLSSIELAGRGLFGPGFTTQGVDAAGGLDPVLMAEILRVNAVEVTLDTIGALRSAYAVRLEERLSAPGVVEALPGAAALVDRVAHAASLTAGVLTGNYEETGRLKLDASGIGSDVFEVCVWGDASPECPVAGKPIREHLAEAALVEYHARFERAIAGESVVVIGDTTRDIDCARSVGARSIGVLTGRATRDSLHQAGADLVVDDLSATGALMDQMEGWRLEAVG